MLTFIEFLEELERNHQAVVLPADELERLAQKFGPNIRQMGFWNKTTDGSLQIPMSNIAEAARRLDNEQLTEALHELKTPEQFSHMLNASSAAAQLIDALSKLYLRQFEQKVVRYQESSDPPETERLRQEISQELFGRYGD
jgi:hypothetical protein